MHDRDKVRGATRDESGDDRPPSSRSPHPREPYTSKSKWKGSLPPELPPAVGADDFGASSEAAEAVEPDGRVGPRRHSRAELRRARPAPRGSSGSFNKGTTEAKPKEADVAHADKDVYRQGKEGGR